jgi:hypothetical protein
MRFLHRRSDCWGGFCGTPRDALGAEGWGNMTRYDPETALSHKQTRRCSDTHVAALTALAGRMGVERIFVDEEKAAS